MKSLFLTLLLGLVAVLRPLPETWYTKAMVSDKKCQEGKGPKKVFPIRVTSLEGGDLELIMTFLKNNQCQKKKIKIVMGKIDEPGKYISYESPGKNTFYIQELPVKDHYIFYCEHHQHHGKSHHKGKLVGRDPEENPEAMEEFKKFVQNKGLKEENIFVPEQRDQCIPESD
ncbi:odorant-binding protein 2b-like [Microtus ochrogaster]|uniref:Odorant-binding protein 2b-like n=1 Tax=Microtus ochrogaster TaxID=79684 RepID=A0ABM0KI05_MICOH|nr:odorant-binding protein 2b-like [Microtus ochrogaster]